MGMQSLSKFNNPSSFQNTSQEVHKDMLHEETVVVAVIVVLLLLHLLRSAFDLLVLTLPKTPARTTGISQCPCLHSTV
jgi:Cu/Ag efflux pump CusA